MASMKQIVLSDGSRRHRVRVRTKGVYVSGTFRLKADAIRFISEHERVAGVGTLSAAGQAEVRKAQELIDRYLSRVLPNKRPNTRLTQYRQLMFWRKYLGRTILADVTSALISDGKFLLEQVGYSNATVNRYLSALSHVFSVAVKEWQWCEHNPVRDVARLREPAGRVRCLTDAERQRLLLFCKTSVNQYLYPIVVLALSTGSRKTELRTIRWDQVNLNYAEVIDKATGELQEVGLIVLNETKNHERRGLPLTGEALDIMKRLHNQRNPDCPWCFPSPEGKKPVDFRRAWESARERARVENFHYHDLRHSAASYLAMQGATAPEIADVLGHKTLAMVKRYSHLMQQHTAQVVARMNSSIIPVKGLRYGA